jgi:peroxiredoxin
LESAHDEFTKRGAALVVIAAQKIDGLFKARDHVQKRNYWFPVLFDEMRAVTRSYGVYHALAVDAYRIARPATFVVGPGGRISWIAVSPSQHERPRLEEILEAIEASDKY